jgi:hypothetical protein
MGVKERIVQFIQTENLSHAKFERQCGLANGFVNSIGKSIHGDSLNKMSVAFPYLSKSWVLTGEGDMIRSKFEVELPRHVAEAISKTQSVEPANCEKLEMEIAYLKSRLADIEQRLEDKERIIQAKDREIAKDEEMLNMYRKMEGSSYPTNVKLDTG